MYNFFRMLFIISFCVLRSVTASDIATVETESQNINKILSKPDLNLDDFKTENFSNVFTQEYATAEIISYLGLKDIGRLQQASKIICLNTDKILKTHFHLGNKLLNIDLSPYDKMLQALANDSFKENSGFYGGSIKAAYKFLEKFHYVANSNKNLHECLSNLLTFTTEITPDWISFRVNNIIKQFIEPLIEHQLKRRNGKVIDWKAVNDSFEEIHFSSNCLFNNSTPSGQLLHFLPFLFDICFKEGYTLSKTVFDELCRSGLPESYPLIKLALKYGYDITQHFGPHGDQDILSRLTEEFELTQTDYIIRSHMDLPRARETYYKIMMLVIQKGADINKIKDKALYDSLSKAHKA